MPVHAAYRSSLQHLHTSMLTEGASPPLPVLQEQRVLQQLQGKVLQEVQHQLVMQLLSSIGLSLYCPRHSFRQA